MSKDEFNLLKDHFDEDDDYFGVKEFTRPAPRSALPGVERKRKRQAGGSQFIDGHYFGDLIKTDAEIEKKSSEVVDEPYFIENQYFPEKSLELSSFNSRRAATYEEAHSEHSDDEMEYNRKSGKYSGIECMQDSSEQLEPEELKIQHKNKLREIAFPKRSTIRIGKAERAIDVLQAFEVDRRKDLEIELKEKDSDGSLENLRKIKTLIDPIWKLADNELIDLMLSRVIYNQDGLISFDKPYAMSYTHGDCNRTKLRRLIPKLAKLVSKETSQLHPINSLEKNATGVLLFASNLQLSKQIRSLMKENRVTFTYNCLTKAIPKEWNGKITIPLSVVRAKHGDDIMAMPSTPVINWKSRESGDRRIQCMVGTDYRVIASSFRTAFLECKTKNEMVNQLRSHLGLIECPIIGDSKYSHFMDHRPQRLSGVTLQKLGIRASKSRNLPIYMHLSEILLPEAIGNRNVIIQAPLPQFFNFTMQRLRYAIRR